MEQSGDSVTCAPPSATSSTPPPPFVLSRQTFVGGRPFKTTHTPIVPAPPPPPPPLPPCHHEALVFLVNHWYRWFLHSAACSRLRTIHAFHVGVRRSGSAAPTRGRGGGGRVYRSLFWVYRRCEWVEEHDAGCEAGPGEPAATAATCWKKLESGIRESEQSSVGGIGQLRRVGLAGCE